MTAADTPVRDRTLIGIGWMLLTTVLFVFVTGIVRHLGSDIPAAQAAFIRYALGLLLILPAFKPLIETRPSRALMGRFALRGVAHGLGVILWFYAMARIPIAEVTALGYVAPIFVTIGAAIFFAERLYLRRIMAIVAGFAGTLLILRPGFQEISAGQLAMLGTAPLFAASYLMAKGLTREASPSLIVGMLSLFCTLTLLPGAIMHWREPTLEEVAWLGLTAAFATAGHYTLTRAFEAAPLTVTQPISFLQLVWAAILGMIVFAEPLDPFVMLGGAVVVGAVTYISHREAAAARRMRTPPAVATKT
ncbi:MAG TPA: DMT family transporter [Thermohalobaculum sp.]|nr:DMT family transporter [Thermohalobaculum sp.]